MLAGNRLKRALFFAITAYEEIGQVNLAILDKKQSFDHEPRFADFNGAVFALLKSEVESVYRAQLEKDLPDDATKANYIEQMAPQLTKFAAGVFEPAKMRQVCLYEDRHEMIQAVVFHNDNFIRKLCELFLGRVRTDLLKIEPLLGDIEKKFGTKDERFVTLRTTAVRPTL
jgi:hypothetical protein